MDYFVLLTEIVVVVITFTVFYYYFEYKEFPPGPYGMPFFGYVPFLGGKPHIALRDLGKKYGQIFSVNMGSDQAVVVNDWESIRAVLIREDDLFSGRPFVFTLHTALQRRENDILSTSGPVSTELKRISVEILKELGMGNSSLESTVEVEVERLSTYLKERDGQLVDVNDMFFVPLMNVIWKMTSGEAFDMSDPAMKSLADALHTVIGKGQIGLLNVCPSLRFLAPRLSGYTALVNASKEIFVYIERLVDEHFENNVPGQNTDFMHCFIAEIKNRKKDDVEEQPPYCKDNLSGAAFDILAAGVETMGANLLWAVLLMAHFPRVQEKVQQELDHTVASDSQITYTSRTKIPYTEATLCEIQRFVSISPFAMPHSATVNVKLFGYRIPKGTTVLTNLWAVDHDKAYWGDPDVFRPERFLNEEGRLEKPSRFIPYSAGPRMCPGKPLAKMQLTLFFSGLMRRFSFQVDPNDAKPEPVLDSNIGIGPHPLSLIVNCRT